MWFLVHYEEELLVADDDNSRRGSLRTGCILFFSSGTTGARGARRVKRPDQPLTVSPLLVCITAVVVALVTTGVKPVVVGKPLLN